VERKRLLDGSRRVANGVGVMNGMPKDKIPVVTVSEGTPTTINDAPLARRLNAVMAQTLGAQNVPAFRQDGMGAEDFAYYVQPDTRVKGYYFAVGGSTKAEIDAAARGGPKIGSHHSPEFRIAPEPAITTGAIAMTAAVLDLTGPGAARPMTTRAGTGS